MALHHKVFGIGLNKTGTTSLAMSLKTLGSQSHVSCSLNLIRDWSSGRIEPILDTARTHQTFEDWPWPLVYEELYREFPDARFILTTRGSAETWFDSLCRHAERTGPTEHRKLVYGHFMPHDHKQEHLDFYARHNRRVTEFFQGRARAQFLEVSWERGDGWGELCRFLECEVPSDEFPHLNRRPQK